MTATGFRERTLPFIHHPELYAGRVASRRGRLRTQLRWGQRLRRWGEVVYQTIYPFRNPFGGAPPGLFGIFALPRMHHGGPAPM